MRNSKSQHDVQLHKFFEDTGIATNRDKHINEASKQTYANNLFKISFNYTQCLFSNWKICFNVINIRTYDELLCDLRRFIETVI